MLVIIITFISGRAYCSFLCPLGVFQDIVIRVASRFRKNKPFRSAKAFNLIRYSILAVTAVVLVFSGTFLILWLDPFSIYGRFVYYIVSPVVMIINNAAAVLLIKINQYALNAVEIKPVTALPVIISLCAMVLISVTAIFKGRLYCNTVCPVGAFLGFISRFSFFKIKIDRASCISCGRCERVCKSSCIDFRERRVDFSRCVLCFNCLAACPNSSLNMVTAFTLKMHRGTHDAGDVLQGDSCEITSISRKSFLEGMVFLPAVVTLPSGKKQELYFQDSAKQVRYRKKIFASPPGSLGIDEFNRRCTACSLCISRCPSSVLRPAVLQYGIHGMLQPFLDFSSGYCNYDCIVCGQVCPSGAIVERTVTRKHVIRTGKSAFIKENCITYTNGTACGACSEHCPTKAVDMVPFRNGLVIPEVNQDLCTGCGACEYVCPVRPFRAIYVEGILKHETAKLPVKKEAGKVERNREAAGKDDFPF